MKFYAAIVTLLIATSVLADEGWVLTSDLQVDRLWSESIDIPESSFESSRSEWQTVCEDRFYNSTSSREKIKVAYRFKFDITSTSGKVSYIRTSCEVAFVRARP